MQNGQPQHEATQAVQTLAEVAATQQEVPQALHAGNMSIQINTDDAVQGSVALAEATINSEGQLVLDASAFTGKSWVSSSRNLYSTVVVVVNVCNEQRLMWFDSKS